MKPSSLPEAYWSHSIRDLKTLVRLKMEYELAKANQDLENLIYTASKIFGGSEQKSKPVGDHERGPEHIGKDGNWLTISRLKLA